MKNSQLVNSIPPNDWISKWQGCWVCVGCLALLIAVQSFSLLTIGLSAPSTRSESMDWNNVLIGAPISGMVLCVCIGLIVFHHLRQRRFVKLIQNASESELERFIESDEAKRWLSQPNALGMFESQLDFYLWAKIFMPDRIIAVNEGDHNLQNAVEVAKKGAPIWRKILSWLLGVFLLVWSFGLVIYLSNHPEMFNDPFWAKKLIWMFVGPALVGIIYWSAVAIYDLVAEFKRLSPLVQKLSPDSITVARFFPVAGTPILRTVNRLANNGDSQMQQAMALVREEMAKVNQ